MQRVDEDDESPTPDTQRTLTDKPTNPDQTLHTLFDSSSSSSSSSSNRNKDRNNDRKDSMETYQTAHSPTQAYPNRRPSLLMMVPATDDKTKRSWTNAHYLQWINQYLPPDKQVVDLPGAFRDGNTLITLLETLSGKTVRRTPVQKGGSIRMKMMDNIVAAFKFMGREGVVVDGRYTIKGKAVTN
jgi:hypothetical protein